MSHRRKLEPHIPEACTRVVRVPFIDEDSGLPAQPFSIFVTLYNDDDLQKPVINSRDRQDVMNLNGGTFDPVACVLTLVLDPIDTAIQDEHRALERHVLLFEWIWGNGRIGRSEVEHTIANLHHVPHESA